MLLTACANPSSHNDVCSHKSGLGFAPDDPDLGLRERDHKILSLKNKTNSNFAIRNKFTVNIK